MLFDPAQHFKGVENVLFPSYASVSHMAHSSILPMRGQWLFSFLLSFSHTAGSGPMESGPPLLHSSTPPSLLHSSIPSLLPSSTPSLLHSSIPSLLLSFTPPLLSFTPPFLHSSPPLLHSSTPLLPSSSPPLLTGVLFPSCVSSQTP